MKKLRYSVYSDPFAWVEEIIQNCQRAKATHINVTLEPDRIVISDNGIGCSDPQMLFEKNTSGWNKDIQTSESPFGEGFFSTLMAADTITVKSIGFTATFDTDKMFEQNNLDAIDVITDSHSKSGFTLILTNLRQNICDVEKRFNNVAKYIKSPTVSINGKKIKYEGLTPNIDNPFIRRVDTPFFKGWIKPYNWLRDWSVGSSVISSVIKCFAFSRKILDSEKYPGVEGVLNFKPNTVSLRSPDRKDFIKDDAYYDMLDCLEEEIKKMYLKVVKKGSDDDLHVFENNIDRYVGVNNYAKYIKFQLLNHNDGGNDNDDTDNIDNTDNTDTEFDDSTITNIDTADITSGDDISINRNVLPPVQNVYDSECTEQEIEQISQTGHKLPEYGFYIKKSTPLSTIEQQLRIAKKYNIPIITLRNYLEERVVETMPDLYAPIEDMNLMIGIDCIDCRNTVPCTLSEIRMSKLLSRIANLFGADKDLFIIADINFERTLQLNQNTKLSIETINKLAIAYNDKIYINRKMLMNKNIPNNSDMQLTDEDIKFILLNIGVISEAISHCLYHNDDKTLEHAECINAVTQRIIHSFYKS